MRRVPQSSQGVSIPVSVKPQSRHQTLPHSLRESK